QTSPPTGRREGRPGFLDGGKGSCRVVAARRDPHPGRAGFQTRVWPRPAGRAAGPFRRAAWFVCPATWHPFPEGVVLTETTHLAELKEHLADLMERLVFARVPFAREFHAGQATDWDYYKRHRVETVLRIRLNNEVDSYCLYKIASGDHKLAKLLATYLA